METPLYDLYLGVLWSTCMIKKERRRDEKEEVKGEDNIEKSWEEG